MALLKWNYQGYVYQEGVSLLIAAYDTAANALQQEWERTKDEASVYQDGVASGEREWIGERDDEHVLWDQQQVYDIEIESKLAAQSALRKAFALSIYHHWERGARVWTGDDVREHKKLVKAVEAKGVPVSPRLEAIKDLANLLKHDNDDRGADLLKSWPDVLPSVAKWGGRIDWYESVALTDYHLTEAFNIIAASGPNLHTVFV